jgi:hypothetical protein
MKIKANDSENFIITFKDLQDVLRVYLDRIEKLVAGGK